MAEFFIRRPIVAMVLSILMVIVGAFTLTGLPISEYPEVSPPVINVTANYRGAASQAVESSVATPIEGQVNGVEDMIYMKSVNAADGSMSLTATFDLGTNSNINQVNVQNRASLAFPRLPEAVTREGVSVKRSSPDILMVIGLFSPKGSYDAVFLSNYATLNMVDAIARVKGVGDVKNFTSQDYAMRLWIDPDRLASLKLTPSDVVAAVREQNVQAAAGLVGAEPARKGQEFQYNVVASGLLQEPEEFEQIIIRSNPDGSQVKVKDVDRQCEWSTRSGPRHLFGPRSERPRHGGRHQATARVDGTELPTGRAAPDHARLHPAHQGLHGVHRPHPLRGHGARHFRRLSLPPELPRHAHPHAHGARRPAWHLHGFPTARLLGEHAHALWPRARHRHRGG
jgi:Cu/Ag efflux pump CusA